jgi:hypothetical protein
LAFFFCGLGLAPQGFFAPPSISASSSSRERVSSTGGFGGSRPSARAAASAFDCCRACAKRQGHQYRVVNTPFYLSSCVYFFLGAPAHAAMSVFASGNACAKSQSGLTPETHLLPVQLPLPSTVGGPARNGKISTRKVTSPFCPRSCVCFGFKERLCQIPKHSNPGNHPLPMQLPLPSTVGGPAPNGKILTPESNQPSGHARASAFAWGSACANPKVE